METIVLLWFWALFEAVSFRRLNTCKINANKIINVQLRPMITYCKKAEGIKGGIYRDIHDIFEILYFPVFDSRKENDVAVLHRKCQFGKM